MAKRKTKLSITREEDGGCTVAFSFSDADLQQKDKDAIFRELLNDASCDMVTFIEKSTEATRLIAKERIRQIESEHYDSSHDDEQQSFDLSIAGASYVLNIAARKGEVANEWREQYGRYSLTLWPYDEEYWKPEEDPVRQLAKAGALIAAEMDRLLRKGT